MFKLTKLIVHPNQGQDNQKILVDDETWQEYYVNKANLQIEAYFGNTVIQEINLKIYPSPNKDISFQLFNLDPLDRECNIIKGKMFKSCKETYCDVHHQQIQSKIPFTRLRLTILNDYFDSFKIFFFEIIGQRILDDEEKKQLQMEEELKKNKTAPKIIFKPGRSQHPETKLGLPENFEDFIHRVKHGKSISSAKEDKPNEEADVKKKNVSTEDQKKQEPSQKEKKRSYIEIIEDENSVQLLTQLQLNYIGENKNEEHFTKLQGCFSEQKKQQQEIKPQQCIQKPQPKPYLSQNQNTDKKDKFYLNNMIRYKADQIDKEFLQYNIAIENSKRVPAKFRLTHRLNTNY